MPDGEVDVLNEMSRLIDAWCDRRELKLLATFLPAWVSNNGLTDGWTDVLTALTTLRAIRALPQVEADAIERAIVAVERAAYRS